MQKCWKKMIKDSLHRVFFYYFFFYSALTVQRVDWTEEQNNNSGCVFLFSYYYYLYISWLYILLVAYYSSVYYYILLIIHRSIVLVAFFLLFLARTGFLTWVGFLLCTDCIYFIFFLMWWLLLPTKGVENDKKNRFGFIFNNQVWCGLMIENVLHGAVDNCNICDNLVYKSQLINKNEHMFSTSANFKINLNNKNISWTFNICYTNHSQVIVISIKYSLEIRTKQ